MSGHGLFISKANDMNLTTFSNADWGGNYDDRTSTTGFIIYLGSNPISWKSSKQKTVARSSTEAEYRALANAASEVLWISNLLHELSLKVTQQPILFCDNVGATYLSVNLVFHSRMKHLAMDYHFVRQRVQSGELKVSYVPTKDQLADGFTKPLSRQRFETLRFKTGVIKGDIVLRKRIDSMSSIKTHTGDNSHVTVN